MKYNLNISLTFEQLLSIVKQLSSEEKKTLSDFLQKEQNSDVIQTHLATEQILAKDWLSDKEEEVWKNL